MGRFTFLVFFTVAASPAAWGYTRTLTGDGQLVRWPGTARLELAGNPANRSGLSERQVSDAVVRALQRWKGAGGGRLDFDYWQGTGPDFPVESALDGLSALYFSSSSRGQHLGSGILGLTQVWYDTRSGNILETDVTLNDEDFVFSTDPRDTSGSGASMTDGRGRVYVENVLTHELGHAFGLSHSGTMQASMLFMESPEQAHLGCDEHVGIRALYPADDQGSRGSIAGGVVDRAGRPIFGAHVLAISRDRGTVLASQITDRAGRYEIAALEAGTYFLMAEPFYAGPSALPDYYGGMSTRACPDGVDFTRTFLAGADGNRLRTLAVRGGAALEAPVITVSCATEAAPSRPEAASSAAPPVVFDALRDGDGFGVTDAFSPASEGGYYRLRGLAGRVELHALGFSLYSRARASLRLFRDDGGEVRGEALDPVYEGDSGYVNYDSSLVVAALAPGDYLLRVDVSDLPLSAYPAGHLLVDASRFVLLTGSIDRGVLPLARALPENARCRDEERFEDYAPRSGPPPRHALESDDDTRTGFCGSIDTGRGGPGGRGSGPGPGAVAGWLAPWAFMLVAARVLRRSGGRANLGP